MTALDASALLAWLFHEPGHEVVGRTLADACISAVDFSEVVGRFVRDGHDGNAVAARIAASPVEIVPFDFEQASAAARLIPATRKAGLSPADRACLALAGSRAIPALTADRAWLDVDAGVEVRVIR